MSEKYRAIVYIDGFNLFYGCLQKSKYKWLNLEMLSSFLLNPSEYEVCKVYYFSAKVVDYKNDGITTRQNYYFQALRTLPKTEIILGKFKQRTKKIFLNPPVKVLLDNLGQYSFRPVEKSIMEGVVFEEKGTDVNLATRLLIDLYEDNFDTALILSNDTDYKMAIHQVKKQGKTVFVINTKLNHEPDIELRKVSTKTSRKLKEYMLIGSLFPDIVENIRKPKDW